MRFIGYTVDALPLTSLRFGLLYFALLCFVLLVVMESGAWCEGGGLYSFYIDSTKR